MDKKKVKELIEKTIIWSKQANQYSVVSNLEEALDELSKSDWVSVEDGLPEYGEEVWVRSKKFHKLVYTSYRTKDVNGLNGFDKNDFPLELSVTHWKPIEKLEE